MLKIVSAILAMTGQKDPKFTAESRVEKIFDSMDAVSILYDFFYVGLPSYYLGWQRRIDERRVYGGSQARSLNHSGIRSLLKQSVFFNFYV